MLQYASLAFLTLHLEQVDRKSFTVCISDSLSLTGQWRGLKTNKHGNLNDVSVALLVDSAIGHNL